MPDKIDKYVVDNELIDKGWEQMQAILDKEMPINQKKRRILPIWWWSSGIAASLLLASLFLFKENKTNLVNQNMQNQISQSGVNQSSNHSLLSEDKATSTQTKRNSLPIDKNITFIPKSITSMEANAVKMKNTERTPDNTVTATASNHIQGVGNQNINKENAVLTNVTESSTTLGNNATILSQTKTEAQDNAVRKTNSESLRSTLAFVPTLATPFANENTVTTAFDFGIKKASVAAKLPRKFRHGIFGRINYMGFIDNGFSFGYLNQYRINKRHHLQTRLFAERNSRFVHVITETYTLPKVLFDSKMTSNLPNVSGDTMITQVVYPFYENCACAAIARQNNISSTLSENKDVYVLANSWHLGIGVNYAYRLSPRWEASGGFGLSYAAKALEYTFAISNNNSLLESSTLDGSSNTGSFSPNTSGVTNAAYVNFAKEQEIFNRLDGYWEIGMNFYINKRLSLGGGYRRGLIDITKNDALNIKDFNRAITMQSVFFF